MTTIPHHLSQALAEVEHHLHLADTSEKRTTLLAVRAHIKLAIEAFAYFDNAPLSPLDHG